MVTGRASCRAIDHGTRRAPMAQCARMPLLAEQKQIPIVMGVVLFSLIICTRSILKIEK
jgi:hypothetical protein